MLQQQKGQPTPGFPPGGVGTPGVNPQPAKTSNHRPGGSGGQKNPPTPLPRPPSPPTPPDDDDDSDD